MAVPISQPAETFRFDITIESRQVKDVVRVILHTICFQRVFGTIRPSTIDLFGLTFPAVQEADVEKLVDDNASLLARELETSQKRELVVKLLHPPSSVSAAAPSNASQEPSPLRASSSLKSWVPSRTISGYPYAWLAHAFSGGVGQAGGAGIGDIGEHAPNTSEASKITDRESAEKDIFEEWRVVIRVVQARGERDRTRLSSSTASQLSTFLESVIEFVDEKKTHIPAIVSADLCPFPIKIESQSG
ncbi:DUF1649-domain-containing protein [Violaceomyces palustris]|uniref:DUF1649-domain-containing protein n=1 Tax=Violaceomyces palustris TaxID=1673888 RepID=A0ACD0P215_9BASI|nr:DUF1649-domain-containing protein [Violaceomyces palustris]